MKANEIRDWIDSLTQDIDFEYQGRQGCICPFDRNDISLVFDGDEVTVHSANAAIKEPFIDGHSIAELCSSPDFVI